MQVLWLGLHECCASWEPSSSVPQSLVEQFEAGNNPQSRVETATIYGHISGTVITTSSCIEKPQAKRIRQERACYAELEGYVNNSMYVCDCINLAYIFTLVYSVPQQQQCRLQKVVWLNSSLGPSLLLNPSLHIYTN